MYFINNCPEIATDIIRIIEQAVQLYHESFVLYFQNKTLLVLYFKCCQYIYVIAR